MYMFLFTKKKSVQSENKEVDAICVAQPQNPTDTENSLFDTQHRISEGRVVKWRECQLNP